MKRMGWEYIVVINLQNALSYLKWLDLTPHQKEFYATSYEKDMGDMTWNEYALHLAGKSLLKMEERLDMIFLM